MKKISTKLIYKTLIVSCLLTTFSCRKTFDLAAKDQVDAVNNYQNVFDANAAVIGIYGKFMGLADRYTVLNELRADLVSPTANADINLRAINEHTETADNPWADPKPWYNVILNINDAMSHFDTMLATGKLTASDYQQRYSDIGALRCWLYLQLGTMYGDQVRYVTDPLTNLSDLNDASKYPPIKFADLLKKLLEFMNDPKRNLENYSSANAVTGATNSSLIQNVDGYATNLFFIPKYAILGDLNLWAGNYNDASKAYKYLADYGTRQGYTAASALLYEQYKVTGGVFNISYGSPNNNPDPNQTENPLTDSPTSGWRQLFADPPTGSPTNSNGAVLWRMPFTSNFQPTNPFVNLFSNQGGSYLLTVSQSLVDNWNSQKQTNGYNYDARGRIAVRTINGQRVIMKQLYYYLDATTFLPVSLLQKPGYWMLYRSAALQQHFAEAADNDGQYKVAYALLNAGITKVFSPYTFDPNTGASNIPSSFDPTNSEQTFLTAPYDMDGRSGGPQGYHGFWYREVGTRSEANLVPLPISLYQTSNKLGIEDAIIDDSARELSFEGFRWGDLLRVALRRGDANYIASKVRDKLIKENNPAATSAYAKMMSPGGLYMPFKL